jgi:uncharacterized protein involved in type VI secretion and phage assembly
LSDLYASIRAIIGQELQRQSFPQLAVVTEQHPHASDSDTDNYACTVQLRDLDIELQQVPVMAARKGFAAIPDVGDLVVVQFLNGDINSPIITGSVYNDEDRPPVNSSGQSVMQLPLGGGVDLIVNSEDTQSVTLAVGDAVAVELVDDDPVITIKVGGNTALEIGRDGGILIESGANMDLKASANVTLEAGGTLTLKGAKVDVNP